MSDAIAKKIDHAFSKYPKREYPKGQILVFAGEKPEHIFYIAEGKVRKYDVSYRGDEVIVNVFKPPAFFPMSWAVNETENKFFYKTEADSVIHVVPAADALKFLTDNPDVMLDLLSRLYKGMEGILGRLVHLMSGTARSRLIYELIIECRRFGKEEPDGSLFMNSSEADFAARSGLTRETVSREMKKLKAEGLIDVTAKGITILDIGQLEQKLGTTV